MRRALWIVLVMGGIGCGPPSAWVGLSPDHRTAFAVAPSGDRSCLEVDGRARRCFDGVAVRHVIFSPDSRRMAFPARDGDRWYVVVDGIDGPPVDGVGDMVFSRDGRRLAYAAVRGGAWYVVENGTFGEPFDSLFAGTLTFDPTGRRLGFVAWVDGRAVPVIDGRPEEPRAGVAHLTFSADGEHVAYVARSSAGARVVVDGAAGITHEAISELRFGPGPGIVAYVARDDGAWWVLSGGSRWGPYAEARAVSFGPGGGRITYVARDQQGERVIVDGTPGPTFAEVDAPVAAEEGEAWGYVGRDGRQSTVVLSGRVLDAHLWAGSLTLSPDGHRYAYAAASESSDLVIHDQGFQAFDMVVEETLQFVGSGERWACLAGDLEGRDLYVVVEGIEQVRDFDWSAFAGVARSRTVAGMIDEQGVEALRAWVAVEARKLIDGGDGAGMQPPVPRDGGTR